MWKCGVLRGAAGTSRHALSNTQRKNARDEYPYGREYERDNSFAATAALAMA